MAQGADGKPPPSATAAVVTRLRQSILAGEYLYSDRLPAERKLATELGASRGTVRSALQRLEEMGLVDRRAGSGTFVRYGNPKLSERADIAEITSPLELIDVRMAVEPQMVRLAVVHARERDIARLREVLHRLNETGDDPEAFSRADEAFHLGLAEATRNPLMEWVYREINEVRGHTQWSARKDVILSGARIRHYNEQHRRIYEAVRSRHVESAVSAITKHLQQARRDLLGSVGN